METRHLQTGALITFQNFPFVSRLALGFRAGVCAGKSAQSWLSLALLPTPPPPRPCLDLHLRFRSPGAGPGQGQTLCFSYLRDGGL